MHAMLHDAFDMHEVREDNRGPKNVEQVGEENVNEEPAVVGAQKYYDMLKKVEKPLHGGTKHSKLSATVHLLEFINQLLPTWDDTLLANTYESKKYLSDIGLGYEKIHACRNNCM
jgi:hypothetical protein